MMNEVKGSTASVSNVEQMPTVDVARAEAARAAALLLESYVWTVTLRCRADLNLEERLRLDTGARKLRLMGLLKAQDPRVKRYFVIDEDDLRQGSIGIARMRARCEFCDAWAFFKEVVNRSLSPASEKKGANVVVRRGWMAAGEQALAA